MVIDLGPAVGEELHVSPGHALLGDLHAGVLEEPLFAEAGFDGDIGAFAEADVVDVRFGLLEGTGGFEDLGGLLAGDKTVQAGELGAGGGGHPAIGREDIDDRQLMSQSDLIIRLVVGRGDLEDAGAELEVHMVIGNDGDDALFPGHVEWEGAIDVFADEVLVTRVLRVDGDGGVGGDGFGACGCNGEPGTAFGVGDRAGLRLPIRGSSLSLVTSAATGCSHFDHLDPEVIHEALLLLHDHFLVGQRGEGGGAPVDHAFAAVDETLLVEIDEHLLDAARVLRVHGEPGAGPVAGSAESAELLEDDAAVLLLPFPDAVDEGIAAEVIAVPDLAGLAEGFLDDVLGGDAGVIGAGEPEDFLAFHAGLAGEDVLDGVVEDVPEGEDAGDVGRRDDDGIGRACWRHAGGVCGETAVFHPEVVPLGFDSLRFVGLGDLSHDAKGNPA